MFNVDFVRIDFVKCSLLLLFKGLFKFFDDKS